MDKEEYKNISSIYFPAGAIDSSQGCFTKKSGCTFEQVLENGECAKISWIAVFKDGKKVAQIKQSNCDIFF